MSIPHAEIIIDLETNIRNSGDKAIGNVAGSPHCPENGVVLAGLLTLNRDRSLEMSSLKNWVSTSTNAETVINYITYSAENTEVLTLVGHNIKFDLLYLIKQFPRQMRTLFSKGLRIYDTMHAEYLLTGQQEKMIPLGNKYDKEGAVKRTGLAVKYGGEDKISRIAEYWDAGIDTADIPVSELTEYLIGDVANTALIYAKQQHIINHDYTVSIKYLMDTQMDALLATTYAEYNGMKFNPEPAFEEAQRLDKNIRRLETNLVHKMHKCFEFYATLEGVPPIPKEGVNAASSQQLSLFIFGGTLKYTVKLQMIDQDGIPVVFKSGARKGLPRYKIHCVEVPMDSTSYQERRHSSLAIETKMGYKTSDDVLEKMLVSSLFSGCRNFIRMIQEYRRDSKDLNTYYLSLLNLLWIHDTCIHGNLNHSITDTGRLSSSNPNLQNISGA